MRIHLPCDLLCTANPGSHVSTGSFYTSVLSFHSHNVHLYSRIYQMWTLDFGEITLRHWNVVAPTAEKWARQRTSSYCLLSMITRGEQVDLSCNNKHISDAWQVMASSGNKKPLQFTVSNADSCRRKSFLLSDVPASFSIKALSQKKHQFSSRRLI